MIITRTPYRVSFFGGGTDYNPWFERHGGLVVNSAFSRFCYITIRELPPFFEHKTRVVYSKTEHVIDHQEIEHPSIRNCLSYVGNNSGLEIHHDGDLPAWSGIGSSSSFTVGMLLALNTMKEKMISKMNLAKDAIHVEQNLSKENVGIQDQVIASFGGMQIIEMGPGKSFSVTPLIMSSDYKQYLEEHIMLGFSGQIRIASENAKLQVDKIIEGSVDDQMRELLGISKEGLACFNNQADISAIGKLMHKSWSVKRTIDEKISNYKLDDIYETAMKAGAFGGRLLGAGGGGFFMFLVPPSKQQQVKERLGNKIKVWVPFKFEDDGSKVIFFDRSKQSNEYV